MAEAGGTVYIERAGRAVRLPGDDAYRKYWNVERENVFPIVEIFIEKVRRTGANKRSGRLNSKGARVLRVAGTIIPPVASCPKARD